MAHEDYAHPELIAMKYLYAADFSRAQPCADREFWNLLSQYAKIACLELVEDMEKALKR